MSTVIRFLTFLPIAYYFNGAENGWRLVALIPILVLIITTTFWWNQRNHINIQAIKRAKFICEFRLFCVFNLDFHHSTELNIISTACSKVSFEFAVSDVLDGQGPIRRDVLHFLFQVKFLGPAWVYLLQPLQTLKKIQ